MLWGAALLASGLPVWLLMRLHRARQASATPPLVGRGVSP
jgi:hypothetical protein